MHQVLVEALEPTTLVILLCPPSAITPVFLPLALAVLAVLLPLDLSLCLSLSGDISSSSSSSLRGRLKGSRLFWFLGSLIYLVSTIAFDCPPG